MGHNSADYLHHLTEAMKLAFADREQYYGDPEHIHVPDELVSEAYAAMRAGLLDPDRADLALRPGDPANDRAELPVEERLGGAAWGPGTMHVDAVDGEGNMAAFTPSGGWLKSNEVIPELGFPLGNRMMTFYLDPPQHPNLLAPYKRPRTTISPSLAERDGEPWTVFGTMGGDQQDHARSAGGERSGGNRITAAPLKVQSGDASVRQGHATGVPTGADLSAERRPASPAAPSRACCAACPACS